MSSQAWTPALPHGNGRPGAPVGQASRLASATQARPPALPLPIAKMRLICKRENRPRVEDYHLPGGPHSARSMV